MYDWNYRVGQAGGRAAAMYDTMRKIFRQAMGFVAVAFLRTSTGFLVWFLEASGCFLAIWFFPRLSRL